MARIIKEGEDEIQKTPDVSHETPKVESEKSVPVSQVQKMVQDLLKDELDNLRREMRANKPIFIEKESDMPAEYEPEDYLETPAIFFTHCIGRGYISDRRGGKEFPNPLGKTKAVTFEHFATKKTGEGRDMRLVHIARFVTRSKKEAEWMRNHTCFGIEFYELMPNLDKINMEKESLRLEAGERLKRLNDDSILHMTKEYAAKGTPGIQVLENFQKMRYNLIDIMTNIVEQEDKKRLQIANLRDGKQGLQEAGSLNLSN